MRSRGWSALSSIIHSPHPMRQLPLIPYLKPITSQRSHLQISNTLSIGASTYEFWWRYKSKAVAYEEVNVIYRRAQCRNLLVCINYSVSWKIKFYCKNFQFPPSPAMGTMHVGRERNRERIGKEEGGSKKRLEGEKEKEKKRETGKRVERGDRDWGPLEQWGFPGGPKIAWVGTGTGTKRGFLVILFCDIL